MSHPMMKCGHAAQGTHSPGGGPCCVICSPDPEAYEIAEIQPDLTGRIARCHCGREMPSSFDLAFFEYGGDARSAPKEVLDHRNQLLQILNGKWRPREEREELLKTLGPQIKEANRQLKLQATCDSYFCGCDGWD